MNAAADNTIHSTEHVAGPAPMADPRERPRRGGSRRSKRKNKNAKKQPVADAEQPQVEPLPPADDEKHEIDYLA
jgi:hypothetical protein